MLAFDIASKRMNLCIDPVEMTSYYFLINFHSPMFICSQAWQVCKQKSIPLFCSQDNKFFPYVQHERSNEYQIHKNFSTLIDGMKKGECFKIKESTGYLYNK